MRKLFAVRRPVTASVARGSSIIEGLESRRLLSASPVQLKPVAPTKILAGNTASETVTIRNLTAASETETVSISLAPSLNGSTASGSYSTPGVTQTLTIKAHGTATVKVPFIPPTTLAAGKYHTLATVTIDTAAPVTVLAPGTYTLSVPPAVTTTPSLVGSYSGLIKQTIGGGSKSFVHDATFIWHTTDQTDDSLTGTYSVGSGQTTGTMTGSENTTGAITYTLVSDNINYTIVGKVSSDGSIITGTLKGTFTNNIFPRLNGKFTITRQG